MCDLLISAAMPTLNELAPNREYWTTLHDYLHTPAYRLRLFASGPQSDIVAKIEDGPTNTGAYELEPVSQDKLPQPADIQLCRRQDLHVLNREKDWRRGLDQGWERFLLPGLPEGVSRCQNATDIE
jgi:hypothetical protein